MNQKAICENKWESSVEMCACVLGDQPSSPRRGRREAERSCWKLYANEPWVGAGSTCLGTGLRVPGCEPWNSHLGFWTFV